MIHSSVENKIEQNENYSISQGVIIKLCVVTQILEYISTMENQSFPLLETMYETKEFFLKKAWT